MPNLIRRIIDPCTIKASGEWRFGRIVGKSIRIAGILPPAVTQNLPEAIRKMEEYLIDREVYIRKSFYVETGPTLVAEIEVDGLDLKELFGERLCPPPPRSRRLDPADSRDIRKIQGRRRHNWMNPLRTESFAAQPALINISYPTDRWLLEYRPDLLRAQTFYSSQRADVEQDQKAISDFLTSKSERALILFGYCGWGKSWFVRHYLSTHPPTDMDVGYIDAIDFPHNSRAFTKRLHLRLAEILGEFVNVRQGGLLVALKPLLEREAKGIFPNHQFDDPLVQKWCENYLQQLAVPTNLEEYNFIRLQSYQYSTRHLLLVVDNVDGFGEAEQGILFDQVIETIAARQGVFLIVPLRPSSTFFTQRLETTMQHLHHGHWLSRVAMKGLLAKRTCVSTTGVSIANNKPDGVLTLTDILNRYLNSETEKLIEDLAQGDVRHYIRLFRRLLYSNELLALSNIDRDYFAVDALMLKPGEGFTEESSFVLNCFDNGHPERHGNALIRWRVLEYFLHSNSRCEGPDFDYYFSRLGYDLETVNEVLRLWYNAGAIEITKRGKYREGYLTPCGRRYRSLISNLWYCISVKTGMHIDSTYILKGKEAKDEAQRLGLTLEADTEWVSDDGFISFLADEEALEELRLLYFGSKDERREDRFRRNGPRSISRELWYDYMFQQHHWHKKRQETRLKHSHNQ